MKKLIILAIVLMLSGLLTNVSLAAEQGDKKQESVQAQTVKDDQNQGDSEAQRKLKAYVQKKQDMKARQQTAAELRKQNIANDNPGNTGM